MRETKQFASRMAMMVAAATLVGSSAFAETRHAEGTAADDGRGKVESVQSLSGNESQTTVEVRGDDWRDDDRGSDDRRSEARRSDRGDDRRSERSYRDGNRNNDRNRGNDRSYDRNRSDNRNRDNDRYRGNDRNRDNDRYRGNDRSRGNDRYRGNDRRYESNRSYRHNRQPYWANGRVTNFHRYGGGYRVWVHGARYPFFVPDRYWNRDRFRIGVSVRLGGYYNPGGYYDYYDGRYAASRAEIYGVVESVDYRRNTFVVRNDATGSFVTVFMRDRDYRRDLRAGDYVEIYGDWSRNGLFQAYDIDLVDRY